LAFAKARRDFWRAIGWGLLASFLGVVLAWTQASRIVRPLEQLAEDAAVLGGGELGHRSRIHTTDELGHLAESINAMAETLERREAEAIQAQKMESVGQLAGGIAHDFNNLLTVISGRLELLAAGENLTADELEDVGEIRAATTRAVSLTRQLLAFSRKQLLRPKIVDLNSIMDEIEPMLSRLIGEDVQIVIVRDPALGHILADPGQVHQVLLNLSLNARDAMPNGGLLRIETRNESVTREAAQKIQGIQPGDYVVMTVTDTGHGMDERTMARIFDPFFTTKPAGKGTGLGLSTVYGIVKQSGATITVASARGKGTTFRVYFPVTDAPPTGEHRVVRLEAPKGTESILVVEDERAVRDLATKILESRGYKVLSAAHGGDALQIIAGSQRRIDLVLTDVVMPGMSGRELVESLRRARPGIKVLYMSGYTDDEIVRRGLLDPAVGFIQKPFTAEELALKVRDALDG
jgi:signal transduction histidine kinase/CheY-like chemotaxis protein